MIWKHRNECIFDGAQPSVTTLISEIKDVMEPGDIASGLEAMRQTGYPQTATKGLTSATLLLQWMIWKHRNECIFDTERPSVTTLIAEIKHVMDLWARDGAPRLGVIHQTT